jgi:hypothetical protein
VVGVFKVLGLFGVLGLLLAKIRKKYDCNIILAQLNDEIAKIKC